MDEIDIMTISVSGIITAYDRPEFLARAIESALAQTRLLTELIVVDDGSPSDLASVVAAFGERVSYVRMAENRGANAARNLGVATARGEVVAFLDDDDEWQPEKLEYQLRSLTSDHEASICGWYDSDRRKHHVQAIDRITEDMLRRSNPFCGTSGLVVRRPTLLEVPFDEQLLQGQDWDLYVRLAKRHPIAYVPKALVFRRYGDHHGITLSARNRTPEELMRRALDVHKHRAWLGEWHYRKRLAGRLLGYIGQRSNKHRFVLHAIHHAGLVATTAFLLEKTLKRSRYG